MSFTKMRSAMMKFGVVAGIGSYGLINYSMFDVERGQRALVFNRILGSFHEKVYAEGTHFRLPFIESPVLYEVRAKSYEKEYTYQSRDSKNVEIGIHVLARPVQEKLLTIHQDFGKNYFETVMHKVVSDTVKDVVRKFKSDQLRKNVSREVRRRLNEKASKFNMVLDDVTITRVKFDRTEVMDLVGRFISEGELGKVIAGNIAKAAEFDAKRAELEMHLAAMRAEEEARIAVMIVQASSNNVKVASDLMRKLARGK